MYHVIGGDGKEYGPIPLDQVKQWISEGRLNTRSLVRNALTGERRPVAQWPELGDNLLPPIQPLAAQTTENPAVGSPRSPRRAMAISSLVLGILSLPCLSVIAGVPAIILGHIAHSKARRQPEAYGGAGFAIAGFVLGYCSLAFAVLILLATLLPALARAKSKAVSIQCMNNMKQIGLATRIWSLDHGDEYVFNLSTNKGGTLELCQRSADGTDLNTYLHFRVMSNELAAPKILVCPKDQGKTVGDVFSSLAGANVTYLLRTGVSSTNSDPNTVIVICPLHNHVLHTDGSVTPGKNTR